MMANLPNVQGAALEPEETDLCGEEACQPEKQTVISAPGQAAVRPIRKEISGVRDIKVRRHSSDIAFDLACEGANMLALQMRQSGCVTPLSMSSKAAKIMLEQF